jgi:hypothetical protein
MTVSSTIEARNKEQRMKINLLMTSIIFSVGLYAYGNTGGMVTDVRIRTSMEAKEIDRLIALAPGMMLSETNNVRNYLEQVCAKIAECSDMQMRYRYFRNLMTSACRVNLWSVERLVPVEKIEMPNVDDQWKPSIRTLEKRAEWKRAQKIASIRGDALSRLRLMADQIYGCLLLEMPLPAPSAEQLEPYFKLIEKLQEEERRQERSPGSLCDHAIDQVESYFLSYLRFMKNIRETPDQNDLTAVEARFKQVVGRPIRSAEQYREDARRRTEETIKEHQRQQEANRRALEFQKKYNREHNINEQ